MRTDCSASSGATISAGGGRRPMPLQRRQHLGDHGAAAAERAADGVLVARQAVERASRRPRSGPRPRAHVGGGADQQRVELAAVLADRLELGLELGLDRRPASSARRGPSSSSSCARALGGLGRDRDRAGRLVCGAGLTASGAASARRRGTSEQAPRRSRRQQPRREAGLRGRDHLAKIRPKFIDEPLTFRVRRNWRQAACRALARGHKCVTDRPGDVPARLAPATQAGCRSAAMAHHGAERGRKRARAAIAVVGARSARSARPGRSPPAHCGSARAGARP